MKFLLNQALVLSLTTLLLFVSVVRSEDLYYDFTIKYVSGSPDGVYKHKILSVNGLFPGPTVEGMVGDVLHVTVRNEIQDGQNTSIHWHGMHQQGYQFEDGASQITQCPLRHQQVQTYSFPLKQVGTFWYHSHVGSQYTEGLWGALIIRSPTEVYEYDNELVLMLNEWYLRTAHENDAWHLSIPSRGVPPYPETGMINGRGRFPCDIAAIRNFICDPQEQHRHIYRVTPTKKYRIRVINAGSYASFRFSIDNHTLNTIEVDGIDVLEPVPADVAVLAPGQRYSFLVDMDQSMDRYLIRANMMTEHLMLIKNENINPYPEATMPNVTAVLQYHSDAPLGVGEYDMEPHDFNAEVPPMPLDNPILLNEMLLRPHDQTTAPAYYDTQFILNATFHEDEFGVRRGSFNFQPFKMPPKPLLFSLLEDEELPETCLPLYIQYGDVVEVVVNNPFYGPHPFHLHGHSFWVLGTGEIGDGDYIAGQHDLKLDGVKRDTFVVKELSWGVIRFRADNPGIWPFHCHIDWHNLTGMMVNFIEAPEICRANFTIPAHSREVCDARPRDDKAA